MCRPKVSKNIENLNGTIEKLDLLDTCETLNQTTEEHTFISNTYETFAKLDNIVNHKLRLEPFGLKSYYNFPLSHFTKTET